MRFNYYLLIFILFLYQPTYAAVNCDAVPKKVCVEPGGIKYFNGLPLNLDCWRYQVIYVCQNDYEEQYIPNRYQTNLDYKDAMDNGGVIQKAGFDNQFDERKTDRKEVNFGDIFTREHNEQECVLEKICDQQPKIIFKDLPYPGCQKRIGPNAREECLIGRFDIGSHKVVIPKFRTARIEVAGSRHGYLYVSAVNETTGTVIYQHTHMSNGASFEITSSNKDGTYVLIIEQADGCNCQWPGYLTVYIDNQAKEPVVESWEEINCHEI